MDALKHGFDGENELFRHRIDTIDERIRDAEETVCELQKSAYSELMAVELIKKDIVFIKDGMSDILSTLREMSKTPISRWNQIITAAISAGVAAVSALILKGM